MLVTTDYSTFGTTPLDLIQDVTQGTNIENKLFFNDTDALANTLNYQVSQFYKLYSVNFAVQIYRMLISANYSEFGTTIIPTFETFHIEIS